MGSGARCLRRLLFCRRRRVSGPAPSRSRQSARYRQLARLHTDALADSRRAPRSRAHPGPIRGTERTGERLPHFRNERKRLTTYRDRAYNGSERRIGSTRVDLTWRNASPAPRTVHLRRTTTTSISSLMGWTRLRPSIVRSNRFRSLSYARAPTERSARSDCSVNGSKVLVADNMFRSWR